MKTQITNVVGVQVLCPKLFGDNRGSFMELWNVTQLKQVGIDEVFVQDNVSTSIKGVLRGVHTQIKYPQAKIVACLQGQIFDVAVECRVDSPSYGMWHGEFLSGENRKQLYIPAGVAHGFLTLEDAMVYMKVTTHYVPGDEIGFRWDDANVNIAWPIPGNMKLTFAEKDLTWKNFKGMMDELTILRQN